MTLEDLFIKVKNLSELMIDLAYSSVLYNNKDLAEEVLELEVQVDNLIKDIQYRSAELLLEDKNIEKTLAIIRLAYCIEAIADGGAEIAEVIIKGLRPHPILEKSVNDSEYIISRVKVFPNSILVNKSLGCLNIASKTGMWLIAIKRASDWIYPNENTVIEKHDIIFMRGPKESEKLLCDLAEGNVRFF